MQDQSGMPFSPDASQLQVIPYGVEIPNRVFVGGCPYNMTDLELAEFFSQFGTIKDSKIITDRDTGKSKGYGFVTFMTEEEAAGVHTRGSIYYKEKKLNVSKAIRKHGGQYPKANTEFVNGQRTVWLHPGGYLLSQYDGSWHFEPTHPHTQPAKPCYTLYPNMQTGIYLGQGGPATSPHATAAPYIQSPMLAPSFSPSNSFSGPGGFYPPTTYAYMPEPIPPINLNPAPPSHPYTFTPSSTTTVEPHDEPRTSLEDSGSHSISSVDPAHLSDDHAHLSEQGTTATSEGEEQGDSSAEKPTSKSVNSTSEAGLEDQVKQLSLDSAYTSEADITDPNRSPAESALKQAQPQGSCSSDSESSTPISQELLKSIFSKRSSSAPNSPYQKRYPRRSGRHTAHQYVSVGGPRAVVQQPFL